MSTGLKYILLFLLISLLFVIRAFESALFYDPLILYFQNDYLHKKMPDMHIWELLLDILFRYTLNSLISIAIIHLIFPKKKIIKFVSFFLMSAFIILILVFVYFLKEEFKEGYLFLFCIRRFLIHPLFLLLLLPAFYYQKINKNKF
jgi:exosortase F-associated protein